MSFRRFTFILGLLPVAMLAQSPTHGQTAETPNATTKAVLLANCPVRFTEEEWLRMMELPVNRTLYPLRITQAMLDTLDAKALDLRFRYEIIRVRDSQ